MLVFSYEQSKPKAVAPLVGWAGAVLVGMAAETLVTMGVKGASKAVLKKQADNYAEQAALAGKFDFPGTNPYRNKDGSITLSPTANDRAKMAGLISGALIGSMYGNSTENEACYAKEGYSKMPVGVGASVTAFADEPAYMRNNALVNLLYVAYKSDVPGTTGYNYSIVRKENGQIMRNIFSNENDIVFVGNGRTQDNSTIYMALEDTSTTSAVATLQANPNDSPAIVDDFYAAAAAGETINLCDEIMVPSSIERVYPAPMDMSSTYQMPNAAELANQPITIYNVFPAGEEEGEVTWQEIDDYYANNGLDARNVVDSQFEAYLENGDYNSTTYTADVINNYYTDSNYPVKVEDFNPDTGEIVPVPDGEVVPVEPIDRNMLQVITESYSYLADSVDTSLTAMRTVTDGATGLVDYLDQSFRWLPAEWRALFGAAFVLGVFAHFFRR